LGGGIVSNDSVIRCFGRCCGRIGAGLRLLGSKLKVECYNGGDCQRRDARHSDFHALAP
jgi:hypothetical protein